MDDLVAVELDGTTVWIEPVGSVQASGESKIRPAGAKQPAETALAIGERLLSTVTSFCGSVVSEFGKLAVDQRPQSATVEFGLSLSAEGNVYVVKGSADATLKITAEWALSGRGVTVLQ